MKEQPERNVNDAFDDFAKDTDYFDGEGIRIDHWFNFNEIGDRVAGFITHKFTRIRNKGKDNEKKVPVICLTDCIFQPSEYDEYGPDKKPTGKKIKYEGIIGVNCSTNIVTTLMAIKEKYKKPVEVGGKILIRFSNEVETGQPQPMKVFEINYKPPKTSTEDSESTQDDDMPF